MKLGRMRRGKWFAILVMLLLAFPTTWIGWNQATYNFAILQPARVFRSGQMSQSALRQTLREYHIKTVLNLRGPNLKESWYRKEIAATLAAGATQVDVSLSSCVWMSRVQLRTLIRVLDTCDYPLLIHCAWGSERTGLTAAVAELLSPSRTLADARRQLALRFLFVRLGDGRIMAEFLDQYENWLLARHQEHRPDIFRQWIADGYVPGEPNREEWPYDPYPMVVVTHPYGPEEQASPRNMYSMTPPETIKR